MCENEKNSVFAWLRPTTLLGYAELIAGNSLKLNWVRKVVQKKKKRENPKVESILSHLQTTIHLRHRGSQRCYFSKLALSTSCRGCASVVQGKVENFWGPVPLVSPSLSPASSGAALWGCHNCGLYNMGYCWRELVTVDKVFKEASLLVVSVKALSARQLQA